MSGAAASGQYLALDAEETLAAIMADGMPDPGRFAEVVGDVVAGAVRSGRRVRVFGELVACLWGEGNCDATVELEHLWNELRAAHPFPLFCAYALNDAGGAAQAARIADVCAAHTRVVPAESFARLESANDRSRAIVELQQKAALLEAELAERRRAEEALRRGERELAEALEREQSARMRAEEASRLKDEFLATISHELKTPLNAILGWSDILSSREFPPATLVQGLETISRNARSQAQLVDVLLDVSRVITGRLRLEIGPVDLVSVVESATDSVRPAADSKGIGLALHLDPAARHIAGDASRLQQIVWNLLSNAIKFTRLGGEVDVRLERVGTDVVLTVSDTGIGIDPHVLPFVFDRFRQADSTTTRRHGGLGLGLAIARHLVELHGGTIRAESAGTERGATFTVTLPNAGASALS